jgi:hypothetical protein
MATATVDHGYLIPKFVRRIKQRKRHSWTYESLAQYLGIEDEIINIYVDPSREIISIITRPEDDFGIEEGQEAREVIVGCEFIYEGHKCRLPYRHAGKRHNFIVGDEYYIYEEDE